eukprot:Opistho-1_new@31507
MTWRSASTMSIQTLTSDAGLLDIATLSKLAGEFFAELPDGGSNPALAPRQQDLSLHEGTAPQLEAAPAGQGHAAQAPRQGGAAQGVPQAYAAALPLPTAAAPSKPNGGGYYFINEASAPPSTAAAAPLPTIEDRVTPQSFGLPGQDTLKSLLTDVREINGSRDSSGGYYFIQPEQVQAPFSDDRARAGQPQTQARSVPGGFDVNAVRRDFPILQERVNGKPLIWLDNAATTQKPQVVIDRLAYFYQHENSNIHRAAHELAARATDAYEGARTTVARFLGAASSEEIIFVRGATEGINLVAKSWGAKHIGSGDEIIVSQLEHHANTHVLCVD